MDEEQMMERSKAFNDKIWNDGWHTDLVLESDHLGLDYLDVNKLVNKII